MPHFSLSIQPIAPLFPYTTLFRSEGGCIEGNWRELQKYLVRREGSIVRFHHQPNDSTMRHRNPFWDASRAGRVHHIGQIDRKSTRLNSSHRCISYAVFCLKKKTQD